MDTAVEEPVIQTDELGEKYIALRDKKKAMDDAHKAKLSKLTDLMDRIEAVLLEEFQRTGAESVRTKAGTAFKSKRTSATVADWDAVLNFIVENNLWAMLEHRVAKTVVEEYKTEHGDLPPGVNWREELTINIRRS